METELRGYIAKQLERAEIDLAADGPARRRKFTRVGTKAA